MSVDDLKKIKCLQNICKKKKGFVITKIMYTFLSFYLLIDFFFFYCI